MPTLILVLLIIVPSLMIGYLSGYRKGMRKGFVMMIQAWTGYIVCIKPTTTKEDAKTIISNQFTGYLSGKKGKGKHCA